MSTIRYHIVHGDGLELRLGPGLESIHDGSCDLLPGEAAYIQACARTDGTLCSVTAVLARSDRVHEFVRTHPVYSGMSYGAQVIAYGFSRFGRGTVMHGVFSEWALVYTDASPAALPAVSVIPA